MLMQMSILIPVLVFVSVACIGGAVLLVRHAKLKRVRTRLHGVDADAGEVADPDAEHWGLDFLEQVGTAVTPGSSSVSLRQHLAHAGFFSPAAAMIYVGLRMLIMLVGVLIAAAVVTPLAYGIWTKLMIALAAGWAVSLIPSLIVDMKRKARKQDIQNHLPDAVDLLEICVSAGMGLDMAWNSVSEEIRRVSPVLADEMALTNLEIRLGGDRSKALRNMAERTDSEDIDSLVGTLVQSERFGTSVSDTLRVFAKSMRELRFTRASEAAEKLGVKMLFPMIAFILPAILIVMGGGAIIRILDMFAML